MGGSVPFQLTKDWPLQFLADAGVLWIDRLPPGDGILLVDKLRHRNLRKIWISQKFGAIVKGSTKSFRGYVNRFS